MNKFGIKDVMSISIPSIGETILYTIITVFDIMLVGRFGGKNDISAVGLSSQILVTFSNILICTGLTSAIISIIARSIGARKYTSAEEFGTIGLVLGAFVSLIVSIFFWKYSKFILVFAGAKGEVLTDSIVYIKLCSFGMFFYMLTTIQCSILKGYKDTYTPFLCACLTILVNLVLDIILIKNHSALGYSVIKCAALSKIISQLLGFLFISSFMILKAKVRIKLEYLLKLNFKRLKTLFLLYVPSSLEEGAISISQLISNIIIMYTGTTAFAANQLANTVESISFMPSVGLSIAATTLVGIKIGEKSFKQAKKYAFTCTLIGILIVSFFAVLFLLIPYFLIHLFVPSNETEVTILGGNCLRIGALEQVFLAVSIILTGALKGTGDTKTPLLISIFVSWFIRLPLMYYFIYILHSSVTVVWWITAFQWGLDAVLTFIMFKYRLMKKSLHLENI